MPACAGRTPSIYDKIKNLEKYGANNFNTK